MINKKKKIDNLKNNDENKVNLDNNKNKNNLDNNKNKNNLDNNKNKNNLDNSNNNKENNIDILKNKIRNLENELDIKDSNLSIFKKKISDLKKKIFNINLRYHADIDNINKRNEKNIKKIYKYCLEKFMFDILPIIDNLKNALKNLSNKKLDINITYEGISLTLKNFISIIKKFGVSIIDKVNIPFDPNYHQAMVVLNSNEKDKDNFIVDILQEGYILNGRLLRPAMVKVIKYVSK